MVVLHVVLSALLARDEDAVRHRDLPEHTRSALDRNAANLNPVAITWTVVRSSTLPHEELFSKIRMDPVMHRGVIAPESTRYVWQDEMYYQHSWRKSVAMAPDRTPRTDVPLVQQESERAFKDGVVYSGNPGRESGIQIGSALLGIIPVAKVISDPARPVVRVDYLRHAGFKMPETGAEHANMKAYSQVLYSIADGGRITSVESEPENGYPIEIVEIDSGAERARFGLDPSLNFAVRRQTRWSALGAVILTSEATEFEKLPSRELWLPKRIEVRWHTWHTIPDSHFEEPILTETFELTALDDARQPVEMFDLRNSDDYSRPGTWVGDATMPRADQQPGGAVSYQVPATGDDLDKVIQLGTRPGDGAEVERMQLRIWPRPFVLFNMGMVVLASLVVWLLTRRTKADKRSMTESRGSSLEGGGVLPSDKGASGQQSSVN